MRNVELNKWTYSSFDMKYMYHNRLLHYFSYYLVLSFFLIKFHKDFRTNSPKVSYNPIQQQGFLLKLEIL